MKLEKVCNNAQCLSKQEMSQILREWESLTENARQAKTQLIAHIRHELHTPLNTILGFAQILDRCSDDTILGEERESIDSILAASRDLLHSIDTLLALEAIEIESPESVFTFRSPS